VALRQISSFYYGFTLPFRSLKLILAHPILIGWSALPIGITLTLYYFLIHSIVRVIEGFVYSHISSGSWLILFFVRVLVLLLAALTFSFIANLISIPFNDFLAEATERWAQPLLPVPVVPTKGIFAGYWRNKVRLIGIDSMKTLAALCMGVLALLCSWVPVINVVAFVLSFLILSFQFISYPQTRRGDTLSVALHFIYSHFFACLGFGAVLSLLFAIPILSSFALPLAVVGGTLLVARANASSTLR
jgi:CysZ protein